jgi:hypothetical protein
MNPIENVWAILKAKVKVQSYALTMTVFEDAVSRGWWAIPQRTINRYISSMHRRLILVVQAEGGRIAYRKGF